MSFRNSFCFLRSSKTVTKIRTKNFRYFHRHSCLQQGVELTSIRYPTLKRGGFAVVNDHDITRFEKMLPGDGRVMTDPSELEGYNTDWIKNCRGDFDLLFFTKKKTTTGPN